MIPQMNVATVLNLAGGSIHRSFADFPPPKEGLQVMKDGVLWVYAKVEGRCAWHPTTDDRPRYLHVQTAPASSWPVQHGLNVRRILAMAYDEQGLLLDTVVTVVSSTSLTMSFSAPKSGYAVVFGVGYEVASVEADGLMPRADKAKLDTLSLPRPTFDSITVKEGVSVWKTQKGGWRDIPGQIEVRGNGSTAPTWTSMATGSPFSAYSFKTNNECWVNYHINHDYALGTPVYLHLHYTTNGTATTPVVWEFRYTVAKGHGQSAFNMTGSVVTVATTPNGTPFTHMVAEIPVPIVSDQIEPDSLILVRIRRVANSGWDNPDTVFLLNADVHYQSDRFSTKNRTPNFDL